MWEEKHDEVLAVLRELVEIMFYQSAGNLYFSYREDVSIADIDPELEEKVKIHVPD